MDHICPPARFDTVLTLIDVNNALDGWMHRVCADLAGCHENSVSKFAVTYHRTNPPRRGGPPCPPARFDTVLPFIDVNNALAGWMHRVVRFKRLIVDGRITNLRVGEGCHALPCFRCGVAAY